MSLLSRRALIAAVCMLASQPLRANPARRIVSIGGAVTEILYRLGVDGDIVGVDTTSQFPADALRTKPNVGYVRALGAEGILSLNPTSVLTIEGAGPPDTLRLIEEAGVPILRLTDAPNPAGILRRISDIARAVDAEERGAALVREVEEGFARLAEMRLRLTKPAQALFILSLQNGRPLVGGRDTTADAILALAGATNVASSLVGWKPLSDEGLIAAAPEAIVMMSQGPGGAATDPFTFPAFAATPAAAARRLIVMDGGYLLGFGPRAPAAALELMRALHPELSQTTETNVEP